MPRRKAEAGLEPNRRAELLRAAARLFVEKGFTATTTQEDYLILTLPRPQRSRR